VKRSNELLVGVVVTAAAVIVVLGAMWLSDRPIGEQWSLYTARFRTVGNMSVGAPVTVRGVRVGQIEAIRLAGNGWVEADLRVSGDAALPDRPAVIAAPSSLFGEWAASVISYVDDPPDDPAVVLALLEALEADSSSWPGATLPDVGQLTAQAGRIASDIAVLAQRLGTAIDSNTAAQLRTSIGDFVSVANQLRTFTEQQTQALGEVSDRLAAGSESAALAAADARTTMARVDSATGEGRIDSIVVAAQQSTSDLRQASADVRSLVAELRANEASLVRVLLAADSVMSRVDAGSGTLGLMVKDSALYAETTLAVKELRQLIADIQANPRRYFKFSVF